MTTPDPYQPEPPDHFAADRQKLEVILNRLRGLEFTVTLGEWVADNVLGDPGLQHSMFYASQARDALVMAETFLRLAIEGLPEPG